MHATLLIWATARSALSAVRFYLLFKLRNFKHSHIHSVKEKIILNSPIHWHYQTQRIPNHLLYLILSSVWSHLAFLVLFLFFFSISFWCFSFAFCLFIQCDRAHVCNLGRLQVSIAYRKIVTYVCCILFNDLFTRNRIKK